MLGMTTPQKGQVESHLFATHLRLCIPLRKERVTLEAMERGDTGTKNLTIKEKKKKSK